MPEPVNKTSQTIPVRTGQEPLEEEKNHASSSGKTIAACEGKAQIGKDDSDSPQAKDHENSLLKRSVSTVSMDSGFGDEELCVSSELERLESLAGQTDLEVVKTLDASDLILGSGVHNICTKKNLKENIMLRTEDEGFGEDVISTFMRFREYLYILPEKGPVALIRNPEFQTPAVDELRLYNKENPDGCELEHSFLDQLPENTRLAFSNVSDAQYGDIEKFHSAPSIETPEAQNPSFYHESQLESLCGLHAANHFLGSDFVKLSELSGFLKKSMSHIGIVLDDESYTGNRITVRPDSAMGGNDPYILCAYIKELADKNVIDKKYLETDYKLIFSRPGENRNDDFFKQLEYFDTDRLIIGTSPPEHFVAFRQNVWGKQFLIDSLDDTVRNLSLSAYLAQKPDQAVHVIGLPKKVKN